ncbi:MAG: methylase [Gemmatimonadetes bacterium]|nr:methylase [Gemmatimonadota bacterium]
MKRSPRRPTVAPAPAAPPAPALLDCFAAVAPGLETFALAEARALGLDARAEEGGLAWSGDIRSVLLANVGLRIASRVLIRLDAFDVRTFAELERHARRIPWSRIVRPGDSARFRVTCKKSRLYHSDAVAQRLADALIKVVPGARAEGSSATESDDEAPEDEHSALFVVRLVRDHCIVSADASGELLHRRGYRQATAKAPLRETLAAALLAASGWNGVATLMDPLCGSGTIPIEAALMARGIAPGARRTFAAERWPGVSAAVGAAVRAELASRSLERAPGMIAGSDRDAGAIEAARSNAERAGASADVELAIHAISAMRVPDGEPGWIVSNPPYGVRVGESERVRDLWAQLGKVLRERAPGWRVGLLSPDPALERQLQLPTRVVAQTSNGGIPVRMVIGQVPGG